jgi:hydroxymethylbilane synthase
MSQPAVRLATRSSRLALAQAAIAAEAVAGAGATTAIVPLTTRGDAISVRQPRGAWVDTDGQFTRELEAALLDGHVDVVVHSYKDLPTAPVDGLVIGAVLERGDPRDCLLTRDGGGLDALPIGARIGTSSPRRAAQVVAVRPDVVPMPIRGNVETRLRRLREGEYDALILAAAGLDRLAIGVPGPSRLPFDVMLPAPAQGALALQIRADDSGVAAIMRTVDHAPTRVAVDAERALLRRIGGGCLAPLGALCEVRGTDVWLRAAYEEGTGRIVRAEATGGTEHPESVVEDVAERILATVASA